MKRRANLTILIAEQNFPEAMRVADRGYVIVHGEIAGQGTREELSSSDVVKKFYFGECAGVRPKQPAAAARRCPPLPAASRHRPPPLPPPRRATSFL